MRFLKVQALGGEGTRGGGALFGVHASPGPGLTLGQVLLGRRTAPRLQGRVALPPPAGQRRCRSPNVEGACNLSRGACNLSRGAEPHTRPHAHSGHSEGRSAGAPAVILLCFAARTEQNHPSGLPGSPPGPPPAPARLRGQASMKRGSSIGKASQILVERVQLPSTMHILLGSHV